MIGITAIIGRGKNGTDFVFSEGPDCDYETKKIGQTATVWSRRRKGSAGRQIETKRTFLILDGYISNLSDFRKTEMKSGDDPDLQTLVEGYEHQGVAFLEKLNGIFNIMAFDLDSGDALIFNDRYGLNHLYYAENEKGVIVSPDVLGIADWISAKGDVNISALADFMNFEFIIGDASFFNSIRLIPAGSCMFISKGKIRDVKKYWDYPYSSPSGRSFDESLEQCHELLSKSIRRIAAMDRRPALALSGGLDSRTIAAYLAEDGTPFECYNIGSRNGNPDTEYSRQLSKVLEAPWHFFPVEAIEWSSFLPRVLKTNGYQLSYNQCWTFPAFDSAETKAKHRTILDGICLDAQIGETFSSYEESGRVPDRHAANEILFQMFTPVPPPLADQLFRPEFKKSLYEQCRERVRSIAEPKLGLPISSLSQYYCYVNRVRRFTVGMPLLNRYHLEMVFPFYDNDFYDFLLKLDPAFRRGRRIHKELLLRYFPEVAAVPYAKTGKPVGQEPGSVRTKLESWLEMSQYALNRLSRGALKCGFRKLWWNRRYRTCAPFRESCNRVLRQKSAFDRYLMPDGMERLIQLQGSGRNYGELIMRLVQIKLFYEEIASGSSRSGFGGPVGTPRG